VARAERRGRAHEGRLTHACARQDELKQQAAWKAVEYVKSGMKIGAIHRRRTLLYGARR